MSSFASSISKVFYGTFIHSVSLKEIEYVPKGLLFVDTHGRIAKIIKNVPKDQFRGALDGVEESKVVLLNDDQFIIPGFVDSHIHAPQYAYCGNGHDIPLLDWLDTLTFPHEAKFKDASYARRVYTKAVARSLRNGTTSACWFATIHLDATKELVKVIEEQGQRAYVGKVNMNQNSPDFLTETTQSSVADTRAFIEYVNAINHAQGFDTKPLVTPIITPRFAISCTSDLLTELGKLAAEFDIPIQSHLCETLNEIEFTKSLFPNSTDYTSVYADHGLLTHRSIMAHCVHIKDEELQLMKDRGAGVSHCASSNFNIKSGLANVRKMVDMDLKGSRLPSWMPSGRQEPARVMELEDTIGNFVVGKEFDAILVNVAAKHSPLDVFEHDTIRTKFEKYLFVGDDRNNEKVYVQGKEVRLPDV
ncbi:hypothetical protein BGZ90_012385 [Linnemannia elongata]|nr:hypothetical protein BGZ90_012385 [Linnemannia elongata]